MKRKVPEGCKAEFTHLREFDGNGQLAARGGKTLVQVVDADGNTVAAAIAQCHPNENFCKKTGRDVALGQALATLDGTILARQAKRQMAEAIHPVREIILH